MQLCKNCGIMKELTEFHRSSTNVNKRDHRCKLCKKEVSKVNREKNYFRCYISTKRGECTSKGITFDLDPEYIESLWTGVCPIFGTVITYGLKGKGSHHRVSAHLDRIVPERGYTRGNVCWISGRANRIKYNATIDELKKITNWMEQQESVTTSRKA